MHGQIDQLIDAATEGTRALHPWSAKSASKVLRMHANGVGRWWQTVEARIIELYLHEPGATSGAIALLIAKAEAERRRRSNTKLG